MCGKLVTYQYDIRVMVVVCSVDNLGLIKEDREILISLILNL